MNHWLFPANTKFYDVFGAFDAPKTYWPMNAKVASGDVIYIYLAAPHKQIGFVCDVLETNLDLNEIIEHIRPFLKGDTDDKKPEKPFIALTKTRSITLKKDSPAALVNLKQHGLNGMLMGPRKLENNPDLLNYIQACV